MSDDTEKKKATTKKAATKKASVKKAATTKSAVKKAAPKKAAKKAAPAAAAMSVTPEQRWHMVSEAAYYKAKEEGFPAERTVEHWLAAEAEIDTMLSKG